MTSVTTDTVLELHPSVAVRPEPFGALLYHFGTRQLSFVKDLTLMATIRALDGRRTIGEALDEAGVPAERRATFLRALGGLVDSRMVRDRQEVAA